MNSHQSGQRQDNHIKSLLDSDADWLQPIKQGVDLRHALNKKWQALVPSEISRFGRVAHYENGKLQLIADNAAYASRLLLSKNEMMAHLKMDVEFQYLTDIGVKVVPLKATENTALLQGNKEKPKLSAKAQTTIRKTAQHIKDARLKAALEKLVR